MECSFCKMRIKFQINYSVIILLEVKHSYESNDTIQDQSKYAIVNRDRLNECPASVM